MKSFDVKELGLEELSQKDAKKVNGGWFIAAGMVTVTVAMAVILWVNRK